MSEIMLMLIAFSVSSVLILLISLAIMFGLNKWPGIIDKFFDYLETQNGRKEK